LNKRRVGSFYEDTAKRYLSEQGVDILESNYRCKLGEIDLIGRQEDAIIFFEVKYRKDDRYGHPFEAVNLKKQKRIISCARYYLTYNRSDCYVRFDVIGIDNDKIEWIKDAFWMDSSYQK